MFFLGFDDSLGSAKVFPHFLYLSVFICSYMGSITLTLASGEGCSIKSLLTGIVFQ